ncbi:MAG: OmpP1/FadL family transporter [Myxococcales bacterium]
MRRLLWLSLLSWSTAAGAQEMDLFGYNPRAVAMGGVQAAADGDFTAVYYNPALLHGGSVGLGYSYEQPFFKETTLGTPQFGSPSVHGVTDAEGYTFGFSVPISGLLRDRVTLGFGGYIPSSGLYRARLIDDGSAVFYRYENAPEQFQLFAAGSVEILPWLFLGGGAQVFGNVGGSNVFIAQLGPNTPVAQAGNITSSELDSNTSGAAAPVVGLAVGPWLGVKLYGCWRGKAVGSYTLPITVHLLPEGIGDLSVDVNGTYHFTPDEISLGASWQLLHGRLILAVDVDDQLWSEAPPPVAIIGVGLPPALNLAYDATISPQNPATNFSDVWVPRIGVEWQPIDRLSLRGGYFFQPTFVPNQAPSPYANALFLDSDTHVFSAGVGWSFDDPLKIARRLIVEAAFQLAVATPRSYAQDDAAGKLSYQTSGVVIDVPVAVRYEF